MNLSGPFVLAGALFLACSLASAQTPALRAAAVDDEYRACAKTDLARMKVALLADGLKKCGQGDCPPETLASMCRGSVFPRGEVAVIDEDLGWRGSIPGV